MSRAPPLPHDGFSGHSLVDVVLTIFCLGWDEGVTQMKVGEKATLDISA